MTPGVIPGIHVPGRCGSDGVYLIVYGSLTEHQLPVERSCRHVKSCRHNDHFCALICHQPGKFRKTEIVADAKSYFAKLRIKNRYLLSRCKCFRFFKILTAFYINVKKMHLPVFSDLMSLSVKNIGSIVNMSILILLRHTAGYEIDSMFCCQPGTFFPGVSTFGFSIFRKIFILVWAAEHFRQNCQINIFEFRTGEEFRCPVDVAGFFHIHMRLKNCSFYNCHIIIPFSDFI